MVNKIQQHLKPLLIPAGGYRFPHSSDQLPNLEEPRLTGKQLVSHNRQQQQTPNKGGDTSSTARGTRAQETVSKSEAWERTCRLSRFTCPPDSSSVSSLEQMLLDNEIKQLDPAMFSKLQGETQSFCCTAQAHHHRQPQLGRHGIPLPGLSGAGHHPASPGQAGCIKPSGLKTVF